MTVEKPLGEPVHLYILILISFQFQTALWCKTFFKLFFVHCGINLLFTRSVFYQYDKLSKCQFFSAIQFIEIKEYNCLRLLVMVQDNCNAITNNYAIIHYFYIAV